MAKPEITVVAVTDCTQIGENNGQIEVTAGSGAPPYQYSLNGTTWQGENIFTGLAPGEYALYVRDSSGEIDTIAGIKVNEPLKVPVQEVIRGEVNPQVIKGEVVVRVIRGVVKQDIIKAVVTVTQ